MLTVCSVCRMARTTRSGAEFSPYGAVPIRCDVDVVDLLRIRFAELETQEDVEGSGDELDSEVRAFLGLHTP